MGRESGRGVCGRRSDVCPWLMAITMALDSPNCSCPGTSSTGAMVGGSILSAWSLGKTLFNGATISIICYDLLINVR
jgi:hypothetical protein